MPWLKIIFSNHQTVNLIFQHTCEWNVTSWNIWWHQFLCESKIKIDLIEYTKKYSRLWMEAIRRPHMLRLLLPIDLINSSFTYFSSTSFKNPRTLTIVYTLLPLFSVFFWSSLIIHFDWIAPSSTLFMLSWLILKAWIKYHLYNSYFD